MDAVSLHERLPSRMKIHQFAMSEESDAVAEDSEYSGLFVAAQWERGQNN